MEGRCGCTLRLRASELAMLRKRGRSGEIGSRIGREWGPEQPSRPSPIPVSAGPDCSSETANRVQLRRSPANEIRLSPMCFNSGLGTGTGRPADRGPHEVIGQDQACRVADPHAGPRIPSSPIRNPDGTTHRFRDDDLFPAARPCGCVGLQVACPPHARAASRDGAISKRAPAHQMRALRKLNSAPLQTPRQFAWGAPAPRGPVRVGAGPPPYVPEPSRGSPDGR